MLVFWAWFLSFKFWLSYLFISVFLQFLQANFGKILLIWYNFITFPPLPPPLQFVYMLLHLGLGNSKGIINLKIYCRLMQHHTHTTSCQPCLINCPCFNFWKLRGFFFKFRQPILDHIQQYVLSQVLTNLASTYSQSSRYTDHEFLYGNFLSYVAGLMNVELCTQSIALCIACILFPSSRSSQSFLELQYVNRTFDVLCCRKCSA
jgi:hypothetical protein